MSAPPRTSRSVLVALVFAASLWAPVAAQTRQELPDGLPVGPLILEPTLQLVYGYDDNVFRRPTDDTAKPPSSDRITTVIGGLDTIVPLHNSRLLFGWLGSFYDYAKTNFDRNLEQNWKAEGDFRLGTGDTFRVRDSFTQGITQVQILDEGFELTFDGRPYSRNRVDLELERRAHNRAGYTVRISRIDLNFAGDEPAAYFDYRGWDMAADYRHPLAGRRWLLTYVSKRSFDHFEVGGAVGEPFRREESGSVQVGLTGELAGGNPYQVRLGYGDFHYALVEGKTFTGLVGTARAQFGLGARSSLEAGLQRRPLPSSFNTYYLSDEFKLAFDRTWMAGSRIGIEGRVVRNRYAEPLVGTVCDAFVRDDTRYRVEAFAEWSLKQRFIWRVSGVRDERTSNCAPVEFVSNAATVAVGIKWY